MSRAASVQIQRGGIRLGDETHALHAACVHYFDLKRGDWRACLERVRAIGFRIVDIPIPWRHHERRPGELALSSERGKHDLVGFLKLVHELGLFAVLRPGPTLNAELTG
ncbi:MAG: beta-galactosidase, partial [Polyangiaceae bacterium]